MARRGGKTEMKMGLVNCTHENVIAYHTRDENPDFFAKKSNYLSKKIKIFLK